MFLGEVLFFIIYAVSFLPKFYMPSNIGDRQIDGLPGASEADMFVAAAGSESHVSHPLDKNTPFYRCCLRFFYPGLLSQAVSICQSLFNIA